MKKIYFVFTFLIYSICFAQDPCSGIKSVDYQGQTYHTLVIGSQCWFKENLNVGTTIPEEQYQENNGIIEKSCYDNNPGSCLQYGGLYQWGEAMQYSKSGGKVQGICPSGWHVPTDVEFNTLRAAVNYDGNALKALGEGIGEGAGTNTSGFSALMAIGNYYGWSYSQHTSCFWSSTEYDATTAVDLYLALHYSPAYIGNENKTYGFPVRCLKDSNVSDVNDKTGNTLPENFSLSQNYPNPFNPTTVISYALPENAHVLIKVYNAIGNEVATLVNENKAAGSYKISFDGSSLPSGIYYYEIWAGSFNRTQKMILVK